MTQRNANRENRISNQERRNRSFCFRVLFIVMAVLILVFDLIFFLLPDKDISEVENRSLQLFPKLNFTTLTNGKFETLFDNYVADQFPGRNGWAAMKSTVDRFAGKTENRDIFLGKDGYLIQNMSMPSEEAYTAKMEEIKAIAAAHGTVNFYALIAPTSLSILDDHLPANAPAADEDELLDRLKEDFTASGFTFLDTRDALRAAAKEEQVYYRTDHHWTTHGAYTAYQVMAEQLSLPGKDTVYQKKLVTDSFSGTLTASSGFRTSETDQIYVYLPEAEQNVTVTYVEEGKRKASFYEAENLDVKDQYTIFFNGNYPQIRIENPGAASDKNLLIVKDSYANCFVPFLAGDYKEILMVDPRYYEGDLNTLIDSENATDVLYLYNVATFIEQ